MSPTERPAVWRCGLGRRELPKALRLYDELGLLPPARVDPDSGYRWYAAGQLDNARLVASLRQVFQERRLSRRKQYPARARDKTR